MVDILRRASQNKAIDMAGLEVALVDVVYATGIGREDTNEAAWWHDGEKDGHLEMARQFASMADAPNPLNFSVCTDRTATGTERDDLQLVGGALAKGGTQSRSLDSCHRMGIADEFRAGRNRNHGSKPLCLSPCFGTGLAPSEGRD